MNDGCGVAGGSPPIYRWGPGWAWWHRRLVWVAMGAVCGAGGCTVAPTLLLPEQQQVIDRKLVEYPADTELRPYITGLTAPTAIAFDPQGLLLIAEGGYSGHDARIIGFRNDGTLEQIYPKG